jgi:hypothetical protein
MPPLRRISHIMTSLPRGQKTLPQPGPRANGSNGSPSLDRGILQDPDLLGVGTIDGQKAVAEGDEVVDELHALHA